MDSERWRKIEQIFHAAADLPGDSRRSYLDGACGDDSVLRNEVELLLAQDDPAAVPFDSLVDRIASSFTHGTASDLVNSVLGPYKILKKIGAGGMGTVYLAEDERLGRKVALKVLPQMLAGDKVRLRRFQREARAASAMNHPNIITIYEVEQVDDCYFIVTEYIEGQTLAEKARGESLPFQEIVEIGIQVADALAEAHLRGIIHRDIKPGNIMITPRGSVKVLDFGLAKIFEPGMTGSLAENEKRSDTRSGIIIGTVHYMSPEQAAGKQLDYRTDIFSFGIVLYEMATGQLPFSGRSSVDTIYQITNFEPKPIRTTNPSIPPELERIIRKCLEKSSDRRYQNAQEIAVDLKNLKRDSESGEKVTASARGGVYSRFTGRRKAAIVAVLIAIGLSAWMFREKLNALFSPGEAQATANFSQITDLAGEELFPSLSPDGGFLVYSSGGDLFSQRIGGKNVINLTADTPAADTQPAFSPDGNRIAFRSERQGGGIFIMGATGESVRRLTDFGYNPAWSPDGRQIAVATEGVSQPAGRLAAFSRLWVIDVQTGERRLLPAEDGVQPSWSVDGRRLAFWARKKGGQRDIWTIALDGSEPVAVTSDRYTDWNPVWSPDGKYLYFASDRGGSMNLWRVQMDAETGTPISTPEPVTTPAIYTQHISFSRDGSRMAYVQALGSANLQKAGFDPEKEEITGEPLWLTQGSRHALEPSVSKDGEWIALDAIGSKQEDIFIIRTDGTGLRQLTDDTYRDRKPRWSPDGKRIAFYSDRSGVYEVWTVRPDGSELQQLTFMQNSVVYPSWSADGKMLSFCMDGGLTLLMELGKDWNSRLPRKVPPLRQPGTWFIGIAWSPDSKKLAGWQGRDNAPHGGLMMYYPDTRHYELMSDFGISPVWLNDNRRLIFEDGDKLYLLDTVSKRHKELLSVAPDTLVGTDISSDNRSIYYSVSKKEADIWLLSWS